MKRTFFLWICTFFNCLITYSQSDSSHKTENIKTFARLYGYVRYFHPSDEAAALDWNRFAVYGCRQVANLSTNTELISKLNELFRPVAPSIKIFPANQKLKFYENSIRPEKYKDYREIYWQHLGLGDTTIKYNAYKSRRINRTDQGSLFRFRPKMGDYISGNIGNGISCIIPICIYGNSEHTYPVADTSELNKLLRNIDAKKDPVQNDRYTHLANLVITFNVMQHFYPYFDVIKTNWEDSFTEALNECFSNNNELAFFNTLKKFTAQLHDGHIRVSLKADTNLYLAPLKWEIIENKLVITKVLSEKIDIPVGSVVEKVNGIPAADFLAPIAQMVPSPTKGAFNHRLEYESLIGNRNDSLDLFFTKPDGSAGWIKTGRTLVYSEYRNKTENKTQTKLLLSTPKTIYINFDQASMEDIDNIMDQLKLASTIICDLRGYPNNNHKFIQHLLVRDDTATSWMRIPQIIYPDYKVSGFDNRNWKLKALDPHLKAKIIFIIDGTAISYAESFMGYIEGYKLATIIGEPTAGTNGNVNTVRLAGGYSFRFTGMKVVRHNGSQQHGIGILPDVYVNKTIKGVTEGRDEFLEKALELAR
jgi:hypothetical protein